jgi:hypothetical protein
LYLVINVPTRQKALHQLPFTIHQLLFFAFPIRFVRSIARAVLAEWVGILEEKMAGAGAPEGLPLNFRFSPDLSGQDSPTLQWGTLILVTPTKVGVMRCLFRIQMFVLHLRFADLVAIIPEKKTPRFAGRLFFRYILFLERRTSWAWR